MLDSGASRCSGFSVPRLAIQREIICGYFDSVRAVYHLLGADELAVV